MSRSIFSPAFVAAALLTLTPVAFADKVIPCAIGSGTENGCSFCAEEAFEIGSWTSPTTVENFNLATAAVKGGGGYDVWWNIPDPDEGCRVVLTTPYLSDKGSLDSRLSGNTVLSVNRGGCYFAHVGTRGVSVGLCCGSGDCESASAITKRELPMSRITRGLRRDVEARGWGGRPEPAPPAPETPSFTCTDPVAKGDKYTKAGKQQIDGQTLTCNGGESCNMSPTMSVSTSDSLMNERSVTETKSTGGSLSIMAGWMLMPGPMGSVTGTVSHDESKAITDAFAETNTKTITKSLSLSVGIVRGVSFNLWFTPLLDCQSYATTCGGVDLSVEKCVAKVDGEGNPEGDHGVMAVG